MNFNIKEAIEILERTPQTLELFLTGLSDGWLQCNEGEGTWNAHEVIDHLIEGEKNNWMPRLEFILQEGEGKAFPPFDRYAHLHKENEGSIKQALLEFKEIRALNISKLQELLIPDLHLERKGTILILA